MLACLAVLVFVPDSGGTLLVGPKGGVLSSGDRIVWSQKEKRDYLADVDWVRGGKVVTKLELDNLMVVADDPARIVTYRGQRFLTYWVAWATGYAREYVLIQDGPPRMRLVGKFENGMLKGFERTGTVKAFPRHESMQDSIHAGRTVWVCRTYRWNTKMQRFDLLRRSLVDELPSESARRFRR